MVEGMKIFHWLSLNFEFAFKAFRFQMNNNKNKNSHSFKINTKPIFLCLCLFLTSHWSYSNEKSFPAKNINSIVIQAPLLSLTVKQSNSSVYTLKGAENLDIQIEKSKLFIKSQNFSSKTVWGGKNKGKKTHLEISGPSKSLQIFSFSSDISVSNWTQAVFISSFNSLIKSVNTKGAWEISLKKGNINMTRHKSPLRLKAFQAHFTLHSSEGDFDFRVNEGLITLLKSKGSMNFTSNKSKVKLKHFKGNLTGFNRLGEIQARIQADNVDVSTEEGPIKLYLIGQGPKIKAYTETGKIYVPKYFYKKFSGKSTLAKGQIKARIKKGSVSAKTEQGNIYIN